MDAHVSLRHRSASSDCASSSVVSFMTHLEDQSTIPATSRLLFDGVDTVALRDHNQVFLFALDDVGEVRVMGRCVFRFDGDTPVFTIATAEAVVDFAESSIPLPGGKCTKAAELSSCQFSSIDAVSFTSRGVLSVGSADGLFAQVHFDSSVSTELRVAVSRVFIPGKCRALWVVAHDKPVCMVTTTTATYLVHCRPFLHQSISVDGTCGDGFCGGEANASVHIGVIKTLFSPSEYESVELLWYEFTDDAGENDVIHLLALRHRANTQLVYLAVPVVRSAIVRSKSACDEDAQDAESSVYTFDLPCCGRAGAAADYNDSIEMSVYTVSNDFHVFSVLRGDGVLFGTLRLASSRTPHRNPHVDLVANKTNDLTVPWVSGSWSAHSGSRALFFAVTDSINNLRSFCFSVDGADHQTCLSEPAEYCPVALSSSSPPSTHTLLCLISFRDEPHVLTVNATEFLLDMSFANDAITLRALDGTEVALCVHHSRLCARASGNGRLDGHRHLVYIILVSFSRAVTDTSYDGHFFYVTADGRCWVLSFSSTKILVGLDPEVDYLCCGTAYEHTSVKQSYLCALGMVDGGVKIYVDQHLTAVVRMAHCDCVSHLIPLLPSQLKGDLELVSICQKNGTVCFHDKATHGAARCMQSPRLPLTACLCTQDADYVLLFSGVVCNVWHVLTCRLERTLYLTPSMVKSEFDNLCFRVHSPVQFHRRRLPGLDNFVAYVRVPQLIDDTFAQSGTILVSSSMPSQSPPLPFLLVTCFFLHACQEPFPELVSALPHMDDVMHTLDLSVVPPPQTNASLLLDGVVLLEVLLLWMCEPGPAWQVHTAQSHLAKTLIAHTHADVGAVCYSLARLMLLYGTHSAMSTRDVGLRALYAVTAHFTSAEVSALLQFIATHDVAIVAMLQLSSSTSSACASASLREAKAALPSHSCRDEAGADTACSLGSDSITCEFDMKLTLLVLLLRGCTMTTRRDLLTDDAELTQTLHRNVAQALRHVQNHRNAVYDMFSAGQLLRMTLVEAFPFLAGVVAEYDGFVLDLASLAFEGSNKACADAALQSLAHMASSDVSLFAQRYFCRYFAKNRVWRAQLIELVSLLLISCPMCMWGKFDTLAECVLLAQDTHSLEKSSRLACANATAHMLRTAAARLPNVALHSYLPHVAIGLSSGVVKVYHLKTASLVTTFSAHRTAVLALAYSNNSSIAEIVTVSDKLDEVKTWIGSKHTNPIMNIFTDATQHVKSEHIIHLPRHEEMWDDKKLLACFSNIRWVSPQTVELTSPWHTKKIIKLGTELIM